VYANRGAEATINPAQLADALLRVLSDRDGEAGAALRRKAVAVKGRETRRESG
jgi:hypothetical protein